MYLLSFVRTEQLVHEERLVRHNRRRHRRLAAQRRNLAPRHSAAHKHRDMLDLAPACNIVVTGPPKLVNTLWA